VLSLNKTQLEVILVEENVKVSQEIGTQNPLIPVFFVKVLRVYSNKLQQAIISILFNITTIIGAWVEGHIHIKVNGDFSSIKIKGNIGEI